MIQPDAGLIRRFQDVAERAFPGRPVLASITPHLDGHGLAVWAWEVELDDRCERGRRFLPSGSGASAAAVAESIRATIETAGHREVHGGRRAHA